MIAVQKVVLYAIPVILLLSALWFYYNPEQGFGKLKGAVRGIQEYVPNVSLGADKLSSEEANVPAAHVGAVSSLSATLRLMLASSNNNCFASYGPAPPLGEYGTSITLKHEGGKTMMLVYGGTDGRHLITDLSEEFEGMVPCVIGGSSQITSNFDQAFLHGKSQTINYYNPVSELRIAFDTSGLNENRIDFGSGFKDFESQGWLFTPDNQHICFFPTVDGDKSCDGSREDGLDDDCFTDRSESESIPYQMGSGSLTSC